MNQADLAAHVAEAAGLQKSQAVKAVEAVLRGITETLRRGDDVRLIGFGAFSITHRPAREGRNPRTGEAIEIASSRHPKFTAGKGLKEALNG